MKLLDFIYSVLKNKYVIASAVFSVWMLFFDRNDLMTQFDRYKKLKELEGSSAYYTRQISDAQLELEKRKTDPAAFERVGREKYYMKRQNEDVFLFEE
jgi:cell division protein DivIC